MLSSFAANLAVKPFIAGLLSALRVHRVTIIPVCHVSSATCASRRLAKNNRQFRALCFQVICVEKRIMEIEVLRWHPRAASMAQNWAPLSSLL
jgi:hypothetical protein